MSQPVLHTDVDRYVIVDYLAEGGMGAIYVGKKIGIGGFEKDVVLKQLLPEFTSRPEFIELFLREAKLSASLGHANIVHTIDLVAAGNDYFIVMEYVRGGDLRAILKRVKNKRQRLSPGAALMITREVLAALAYAHAKRDDAGESLRLIHRDISPSNIMVSSAGEVKLADFGIAKVSTHQSVFYRVKGKIGYMSPEQARGQDIDHRSDLYSVAIALYEMLAGERLFVADLMSTPEQIYSQRVPRLEHNGDMPRGVDALLTKALAIDPNERFQHASEFQEAVVRLVYENGVMYSSQELADELHLKCGADPSLWNKAEDAQAGSEPPSTAVISEEDATSSNRGQTALLGEDFSRVQLTSVLGPSPRIEARNANARRDEPTLPMVAEHKASPSAEFRATFDDRSYEEDEPTEHWQAHSNDSSAALTSDDASTVALRRSRPAPSSLPSLHEEATAARAPAPDPKTRSLPQKRELQAGNTATAELWDEFSADSSGYMPIRTRSPYPIQSARQPSSKTALVLAALALLALSAAIVAAIGLSVPDPGGGKAAPARDAELTPAVVPQRRQDTGTRRAPKRDAAPKADARSAPKPTALLDITSDPSTAEVLVDGHRRCQTPCTLNLPASTTPQVVAVRREGRAPWSRLVQLLPGHTLKLSARLVPSYDPQRVGFAVIDTSSPVEVRVDRMAGSWVSSEGRIPLPPGPHTLSLSRPGSRRVTRLQLEIKRAETTQVHPKLD